jgi:AcrR family transcriptional regulator
MKTPSPARTPRRAAPRSLADNRERLVQAATEALAEHGPDGFKVLDVAARAEANVALINYHFGGRDGLLREVIRREGSLVAQRRAVLLRALLAGDDVPSLDAVLRAWLRPVFDSVQPQQGGNLLMLMTHLMFASNVDEASKQAMVAEVVATDEQFLDALQRCRPELPRQGLAWRLACAIGSYCFVLGQRQPAGDGASEAVYEELVAFVHGGFSAAPVPARKAVRRRAR